MRFLLRPVRAESTGAANLSRLATSGDFQLKQLPGNQAQVLLLQPLAGPQNVTLELELSVFHKGSFVGLNKALFTIFVGQYPF